LNAVSLLGTWQLPARWNLSFDFERRNAPILTTRNALIGQPETTLDQLLLTFTEPEIYRLARERTPVTSNYSLTANRPIGQRYQFSTTVSATQIGATGDFGLSGGEQPSSGLNPNVQMQLYGSNIWRKGDFSVASLAYSKSETGKTISLGLTSRFPLGGAWRIGPRLSLDRRTLDTDGSKETAILPSMLLDYQRGRNLVQFELGGQLGKRDAAVQSQKTTRYYISLGYRIGF
jgi:hypothetical protein